MTIPARNQHPDSALRETCNAKTQLGTHLASNAPASALFVSRGTGTLGQNQAALSVSPGTGVVNGTEHTIGSEQSVDISGGDAEPRRDVIYLDETGTITVKEGTPAPFAWDSTLDQNERTLTNAYQPPAPDLADTAGLALATVTIGANSGTLSTDAIDPIRPHAPTTAAVETGVVDNNPMQAALDGHVVPVAPGVGVVDAIDPTATPTPVGDAVALVEAGGGGQVLLPPEPVAEASSVHIDTTFSSCIIGSAWRNSEIVFTDTSSHGFVIDAPSNPPAVGTWWHNFRISGSDRSARTKGATSAVYFDGVSPKDFNWGAIAFREWNGSVISGTSGSMAYGSTWQHLAFGYGESDNDGTLLELHGQGAPLKIGQFHAATSTSDPLITTDQPRHVYLDIGTMNIGGQHGPIIDINGGSYSVVDVDLVNFEPVGSGTATEVVNLRGSVKARFGPFLSKTGTVDDIFVLGTDHEAVIGPVVVGPVQTLNNAVVRLAGPSDGDAASVYFGPVSDIDYGSYARMGIVPVASPHAAGVKTTSITGPANHTADYGATVLVDDTGGDVTVTLPSAADGARVTVEVIASSSNGMTAIETPGNASINGSASLNIGTEGNGEKLISDGTDWWGVG